MWQLKDLIGNAEAAAALAAYKEKHAEPADMSNDMDVPSGLTEVRACGVSFPYAQIVVWGVGCNPYLNHTCIDVLVHPCVHPCTDATVADNTLQAQERALKELNMLKNGRDTLDMSVLDGCTDDNLRTRIGEPLPAMMVKSAFHVGRFHCSLLDFTIWQHEGAFLVQGVCLWTSSTSFQMQMFRG